MKIEIDSLERLRTFAETLAGTVATCPSLDVALLGPLGAGKTTLVRYFAESLGAAEPVSSPSYVLQHEYHCGSSTLEHWDLYRLNALPPELEEAPARNTIRLVEWADRAPEFLKECEIIVRLDYGATPEARVIDLTVSGGLLGVLTAVAKG